MDEASFLRQLSRYPRVRPADFYAVPHKRQKPLQLTADASVTEKVSINVQPRLLFSKTNAKYRKVCVEAYHVLVCYK
eukprot:6529-Heterococcus_DN1.PRE.4